MRSRGRRWIFRAHDGAQEPGTAARRGRSPFGPLGMTHLKNNEAPANDRGYVADASHVS